MTTSTKGPRREKLAAYFYDLSKLTFAALVLGGIPPLIAGRPLGWSAAIAIITGSVITFSLALIANKILK